jgi:hypothetical protein
MRLLSYISESPTLTLRKAQSPRFSLQSSELAPPCHLTRKRVFDSKGGHTSLRKRGRGEPIRIKGQALWYSWSSIIPLGKVISLTFVEFPPNIWCIVFDTSLTTYESFVIYSVRKIVVAVRGLVAINISCGLQNRVPGFTSSRPNWPPPHP